IRKDISLDTILIDAIYTPVKKVAFHVENTRVGPLVDYEKLIFDVWTNGAVTPDAALKIATDILNNHFIKIGTIEALSDRAGKAGILASEDDSGIPLTELNLSTRIINILQQNDIKTLKDIIETPRAKFEEMKNLGKKSIQEIEEALDKKGYKLKEQEQL
ncbi:MAG: hypothetical protein NC902_00115, partial [Candidatus Omnitrophica bacterium]|nr:hypothetical protein [Candidatus Omnitrophota bacterium]